MVGKNIVLVVVVVVVVWLPPKKKNDEDQNPLLKFVTKITKIWKARGNYKWASNQERHKTYTRMRACTKVRIENLS